MRGGDEPDVGGQGADVGGGAAVDPDAFLDDPGPHHLLLQGPEGLLDLSGPVGERGVVGAGQLGRDRGFDLVEAGVARRLVGDRHRFGGLGAHRVGDGVEDVVVVVEPRLVGDLIDGAAGLLDLVDQLELEVDGRVDPLLAPLEAVGDDVLGDLWGAVLVELPGGVGATGFDHHDRDVAVVEAAAGNNHFEGGLVALLVGGVRDPFAIDMGDAHRADRAVERDTRHHERGGRAVDRRDVVGVLEVGAEDRGDDLHLVAEPVGERRAQRPVGEPAGEDGLLTGASLPAEERAGDLPRGVHAFLDVDGEGEEVDALAGLAGHHGGQQGGVADLDDDGAVGQGRETARLDGHDLAVG